MDILEPLEHSTEDDDPIDRKPLIVTADECLGVKPMESDDEQNVVDHLSPQTLLETPSDTDLHYSIKSPDGMITYRVLQLEESEGVPQIVATGTNFTNSNVQQVLATNLNGQVYMIPNEMMLTSNTPATTRPIAPRSTFDSSITPTVSTVKRRDERRRATHNEVERRRRDKINNWILRLAKIIPESSSADPFCKATASANNNGHFEGQSKGGILAKACEYILQLRNIDQKLDDSRTENKQLQVNMDMLKQKNVKLEMENKALRELLKRNGIDVPMNL